jgi:hypothetical protein
MAIIADESEEPQTDAIWIFSSTFIVYTMQSGIIFFSFCVNFYFDLLLLHIVLFKYYMLFWFWSDICGNITC